MAGLIPLITIPIVHNPHRHLGYHSVRKMDKRQPAWMEKFNFILSLGLAIVFLSIFKEILEDNIFRLTEKS